jgi:hypothetical protein
MTKSKTIAAALAALILAGALTASSGQAQACPDSVPASASALPSAP